VATQEETGGTSKVKRARTAGTAYPLQCVVIRPECGTLILRYQTRAGRYVSAFLSVAALAEQLDDVIKLKSFVRLAGFP
jgi:hypothetical protein